ncbi:GntR family transcriptional regulator [Prosthecomicrobium sp. N25]
MERPEDRRPAPAAPRHVVRQPGQSGLTHAERLRAELADDIVCGRLQPGTALDETTLAARFGVSRTPVREALRELAASGLVVHRAHRGAVVTALTEDRLTEMFVVMAELEALAAGFCAIVMTPAERRELMGIQEEAEALVRAGDLAGYTDANDRFHAFLYIASHNEFLAETALSVRRRVSAFRRAQFRTLGRLQLSHQEHDRVVQAILRGDRDGASRDMRNHLDSVRQSFMVFHDGL